MTTRQFALLIKVLVDGFYYVGQVIIWQGKASPKYLVRDTIDQAINEANKVG